MALKRECTSLWGPRCVWLCHIIVSELVPGTVSSHCSHTMERNTSECICSRNQARLGLRGRPWTVPSQALFYEELLVTICPKEGRVRAVREGQWEGWGRPGSLSCRRPLHSTSRILSSCSQAGGTAEAGEGSKQLRPQWHLCQGSLQPQENESLTWPPVSADFGRLWLF